MDAPPPFSLHIEGGAELATIRPRDGSLLFVESVSPTEVVLRLRPSAGSASAAPVAQQAGRPAEQAATAAAPDLPATGSDSAARGDGQATVEASEAVSGAATQHAAVGEQGAAGDPPGDGAAPAPNPAAVGSGPASRAASETDEVGRAPSNITAEQLSEAQMAVERATRGLTGPDAAKHLEPDGSGSAERSPMSRSSAAHGRQRDNWLADGSHPHRSPGSTPSSSPRGGRGLRTGSGSDWSAVGRSARRASGGPVSRRTSGQSERDEFGAGSRLRHGEADWLQQRGQQVAQVPPPPPRGRQLPPPASARAMDGRLLGGAGRQLLLPGAALGSPAHMISKVKLSMDGEAAALQQAALQHQAMMHRRALRNGALAAARPVTHEAFEFWHEQQPDTVASGGVGGLGAPLESHGSREGSNLYPDMATDEPAAQAVAHWSAMRSTPSPALSHSSYGAAPQQQLHHQTYRQHAQHQEAPPPPPVSRFREPTLRAEDFAQLGYSSALSAAAPEFTTRQSDATQRVPEQQRGSGDASADDSTVGAGGLPARSFRQDSWPPPPQQQPLSSAFPALVGSSQYHHMLTGYGGGGTACWSGAAQLHRQLDAPPDWSPASSRRDSPALPDPQLPAQAASTWGASRAAFPHHSRTASVASEDDHMAMADWRQKQQQSIPQQPAPQLQLHEGVRRSSDPPPSAEATTGLSRFADLQQRAFSDTPSSGSGTEASRPQSHQGSQQSQGRFDAAAPQPPPALFPDRMFEAHKAWSLSSADAEALTKSTRAAVAVAAASAAADEQPLPLFPLPANMLGFLDDESMS